MSKQLFASKLLKEWRFNKGYTQAEMTTLFALEADIELSTSAYQKFEAGTLNLTADMALELSRFTRIPLQDLVERK
jgi:transcriptional regulator with XRE-family HTH domain